MKKIAVIGAGLSGLSAANFLKGRAEVIIFEKAPALSGRMSTRCAKPYFFDHGAKYFTIQTEAFREFVHPLIDCGVIEQWNARYLKFDGNRSIERNKWLNEPLYVGVPGMNKIVEHLAKDLNVLLNTRITELKHENTWQLFDEQGVLHGNFDWVISSLPSPQAAELLPETFKWHTNINAVKMRACFTLMLGFSEKLALEFDVAEVVNSDLSWLVVNSEKPGRVDLFTLIVHSSEDYAESHIDDDQQDIARHLCAETSRIIGHDVSAADYKTVKRWKYANNATRENCPVFLDENLKLAACGDWCLGGNVEGAFTSAYNLFNKMKEVVL